jgi:hypothetical protein
MREVPQISFNVLSCFRCYTQCIIFGKPHVPFKPLTERTLRVDFDTRNQKNAVIVCGI